MNTGIKNTLYILLITATAYSQAQTLEIADRSNPNELVNNVRMAKKQLKRDDIISITNTDNSNAGTDLKNLIDQIQNLHLPNQNIQINSEQPRDDEKNEMPAAQLKPEPKNTEQTNAITENNQDPTTSLIAMLQENPDSIANPFAVAESLFKQGDLIRASSFYKLALKQMADDRKHPDRPWAMFQTANCLRYADKDAAYDLYQKLIEQFPNSRWSATARAQQDIIQWYKTNQLNNVLERSTSDSNNL